MRTVKFKFFKVVKEPDTKEKIIQILSKKPRRPSEIASILRLTRSTVSEHLQNLLHERKITWKGTRKVKVYYMR